MSKKNEDKRPYGWSEEDWALLARLRDNELLLAFPDYTRLQLRTLREKARADSPEKTKKWSPSELEKLAVTSYDDLTKTFPGVPRREASAMRKKVLAKAPKKPEKTAGELAEEASALRYARKKASTATKAQNHLLDKIDTLQKALDSALAINEAGHSSKKVKRLKSSSRGREATAVALASDWHCEESVLPGQVGGVNEFNLDIFDNRAGWFFRNLATLIKKERQSIAVPRLVLWLGGDFISGSIHDDLMEGNSLGPIDAIILAKATLAGGIEYLHQELAPIDIVIPCSDGNHGRITQKMRMATSRSNSLEYFMYASLQDQFKDAGDVRVILPEGYHNYLEIYGRVCRFHHGDNMRYNGGVGGITIPVNKKIANWNTVRRADYDFFGHFHQHLDGGRWTCNGSLIGYGAFANAIAAQFEAPKQAFCLIDKDHGKTVSAPILLQKV